ncbi:unnamed protein product [Urochloa humidicola]
MWPKETHGFFMHPPLLKSTAGGRRKNRMKSALEGGSSRKKKQHECPLCHQFGHHWYKCKNRNPEDIATYELARGPPKKRQKKASSSNMESTMVVATSALVMVFPHNEAVANAIHKPRKKKSAAKKNKGPATTTTSSGNTVSIRSATGSNDPFQIEQPLQIEQAPPRKKRAIMKKLTPKKAPIEMADPSSPASNTRSKKKLLLE